MLVRKSSTQPTACCDSAGRSGARPRIAGCNRCGHGVFRPRNRSIEGGPFFADLNCKIGRADSYCDRHRDRKKRIPDLVRELLSHSHILLEQHGYESCAPNATHALNLIGEPAAAFKDWDE